MLPALTLLLAAPAAAQPLRLVLPTRNAAIYYNEPAFYQYTDRNFRGQRSQPWEGGQYGYVRSLKDTPEGVVYTRFHEGLDIKPLFTDDDGEPLDTVRTVDAGRVVYVNRTARRSNYGKYIVVEHLWDGSPFYTLYAHLAEAYVYEGQRLRRGERIGRMGYTGEGITKRRAHVHFEINMLLNDEFDVWFAREKPRADNPHGIYNGMNLAGIDAAALYLSLRRNPTLTITEFLSRQEPYFEVTLPLRRPLDLLYRYPWLSPQGYLAEAPSYAVSFTQSGLPVRVRPSFKRVAEPTVTWAAGPEYSYALGTSHLQGRSRFDAALSRGGDQYMALLSHPTAAARAGIRPPQPRQALERMEPQPPVVLGAPAAAPIFALRAYRSGAGLIGGDVKPPKPRGAGRLRVW